VNIIIFLTFVYYLFRCNN